MKKGALGLLVAFLSLTAIIWLAACGGGGGGGSSSGGGGVTPAATAAIDAADVDEIMRTISDLDVGCTASGGVPPSSLAVNSLRAIGSETLDSFQGQLVARQANGSRAAVTDPPPEVIPGTCTVSPGDLTLDVSSYDDVTGDFAGSMVFNALCLDLNGTDQATVTGGATFSGNIADDLSTISLSASTDPGGITIVSGTYEATVILTGFSFSLNENPDGSGSLSLSWSQLSIDVDDGSTSEFVDISDFDLTVNVAADGSVSMTVTGTITTPDGDVLISTPTAITFDASGNITGGALLVAGANGTGVRIEWVSGYQFAVTADTDGDGIYDDYDGEMDCDELGGSVTIPAP